MAALSVYAARPAIVNQAVVKMAVSSDPFPDLGKLLVECERIRRTMDGTMPQDSKSVEFKDVKALAKAWGLEV